MGSFGISVDAWLHLAWCWCRVGVDTIVLGAFMRPTDFLISGSFGERGFLSTRWCSVYALWARLGVCAAPVSMKERDNRAKG